MPPDGSIGYYYALTQFEWLQVAADRGGRPARRPAVAAGRRSDGARRFGHQVRQYHRLFMLPAVGHCGGSTGPSAIGGGMPEPPKAFRNADHHVVSAVIKWVEQGVAPEKIIATRSLRNDAVAPAPALPVPGAGRLRRHGRPQRRRQLHAARPQTESASTITAGDIVQIKNSMAQRGYCLPNR